MTSAVVGRPIVAGVDGSASALHAAGWAADEAARRRVRLRLVHVVSVSALAHAGGMGPSTDFFQALESDGRQRLDEAAAAIGRSHPGVEVELDLREGDLVPTLIDESETAQLVVLGARGLGGFRGMLTGSTAVALVVHGRCQLP